MDEIDKAFDDTLRAAKARLSAIHVQEVSLVDAAANLRRFVVVKGLDMDIEIKKGMKLPGAARKAIMEAVAKELDRLTKFAEALGSSTVDDTSSVPAELGKFLAMSSLSLAGLAKQYGGEIQTSQADPTQKRGAKMSSKRLAALKAAHEGLGSILNEVDPAYIAEKAAKPPKIEDEEEGADDDDESQRPGAKKKKDEAEKAAKAAVAGIEKRFEAFEVASKKQADELAAAHAEIAKLKSQTPGGNSRQHDAAAGDGEKVTWGGDLAAEVDRKRTAK